MELNHSVSCPPNPFAARGGVVRILMITRSFPPREGGGGNHAYGIARGLSTLGHKMIILAPPGVKTKEFDRQQNFPVIRIPGGNMKILRVIPTLFTALWVLRRYKIEMLFLITWASFGPIGLLFKKVFNIPYCILAFGADTILHPRIRWQKRVRMWTLSHLELAVANSHFTAQRLARLGVDESRIRVIPPGTDFGKVNLNVSVRDVVEKHNLIGQRVILTISRLSLHKGHDVVIKAMPIVLRHVPDAVYIIVGRGPAEPYLRSIVEKEGLKEKVLFAGFVPDSALRKYYLVSDLFIMVSREIQDIGTVEGFGIVFLEANACLKPVIGSTAGGIRDAILDGITGFLVDPLNHDAVAEAIIRVLTDRDLTLRMGEQGRRRVLAEFGWDVICGRIEREFREIVGASQ